MCLSSSPPSPILPAISHSLETLLSVVDTRPPSNSRTTQFSPKVQVSALNACSALLAYLSMDDSGMKFRSLVQPCLEVGSVVLSDSF